MYRVLYKDCVLVVFSMSVCSALCLTAVCLLIALIKTIIFFIDNVAPVGYDDVVQVAHYIERWMIYLVKRCYQFFVMCIKSKNKAYRPAPGRLV